MAINLVVTGRRYLKIYALPLLCWLLLLCRCFINYTCFITERQSAYCRQPGKVGN